MTDEAVLKKKIGSPNQVQNEVFCHFLEFGSYVFLEIAYNDSLLQCLASGRGKTHEYSFGGPIGFFLPFSQVWFISFPLNCIG